MKLCFLILMSLSVAACKSSPTRGPMAKTTDYIFEGGYKQVTFLGENESPRFSETGNELIFVSSKRAAHASAQVYEIDLRKNRERRVTFHDGDAGCPSYINGREIFYCSTTDEIKETPYLNKNINKDFPPTEIYFSDVYGGDIERITEHPGYDNEVIYVKGPKPYLIYTSIQDNVVGIHKLEIESRRATVLISNKEKISRSPTLSSDRRRLAWIEKDIQTGHEAIKVINLISKKVELIKDNGGLYRDLFWQVGTDKIYYSVLRHGDKRNQLEVFDLASKCTQGLFKGQDPLFQPAVSNETKPKLAFTREFEGKRQIYMVELPDDLGPCFEATPPIKMEK